MIKTPNSKLQTLSAKRKTPSAKRQAPNAFTLIEAILTMIILGICLTPFCILVADSVQKNVLSQAQATAIALAEGQIENVTSLRFSAVTNVAPTVFASPFGNYNYSIIVDYVNGNDLNTVVAGPTDYKRVQVRIGNSIVGNLTLVTLVTNDW